MKQLERTHRARNWRVHELAADFRLEDIWRFDLGASDGRRFDDFVDAFWSVMSGFEESALARVRLWLGKRLGWDDEPFALPIPGCTEHTVAERLPGGVPEAPSPLPVVGARLVYREGDEALYEISNKTIHALLHLGFVTEPSGAVSAVLAVYVKHRGVMSKLYMAAIWPARHTVIYPAMIARVERNWRAAA